MGSYASPQLRRRKVCAYAQVTCAETMLFSMVAGTDRGRILTERERQSVENVVSLLERENPTRFEFPQNLYILDGKWRYVSSHAGKRTFALRTV